MTRRSLWLFLLLVVLLGGTFWYAHGLYSARAIVAHSMPATPNLSGQPPALLDHIHDAEKSARSWRHSSAGLVELARLYHANGFYPEALTCYDGLQLIQPTNARWPHRQASILASFGRMDEALPLRQRAVTLAPDYLPAHLRLGDVLLKANRINESALTYEAALRLSPGDGYALLGLARCDIATGAWPKAKARLTDAISRHPEFVGALSLLITVNEHLGDTSSIDAFKAVIGRREFSDLPDPWLDDLTEVCYDPYRLSVSAAIAGAAGNRSAAKAMLDRAISLAPQAGSYRRQYGQIFLDEQNFPAAKIQFEKAVEVNPTDSDAWLRLLETLRELGRSEAAVTALLNGLAHCPQSPSLHLEYARWLKSVGRLEESIAEFRYGYQLRPSEAAPLIELATVYFTVGRHDEAVAALHLALERQPDHPMALATLVIIAISQNDEAEARRRWQQVRRQSKAPAEMLRGIQKTYLQQFGRNLP